MFKPLHDAVKNCVLKAIDRYTGPKAVTLPGNRKAVDLDDSWVLIGDGNPRLRNKKDQRLIEKGLQPSWDDKPLSSIPLEELCTLADNLIEN